MIKTFSWGKLLKNSILYILLIAAACIFIGPFLWLISTALKPLGQDVLTFPPSFLPKPPVLDNFIEAWTAIPFPRYMLNSILLVLIMVPAHIFLTAFTAYPLARMKFKGRNFIFYAIIATMFLPEEGKLVPLYIIVDKLRMTDSWLGLIFPGLIGGFSIFLMRQSYLNIPKEIEEAATIDGCGPFRTWWSIILPLTKPTLAALSVFSFVSVWNSFTWPLIILKNEDLYPIALGLNYLQGTLGTDIKVVASGVALSMIPIFITFLFLQKYFVSGLQGSVKE